MTRARRLPGSHLALGPGAEFDRIRNIIGVLGAQARGLGDDCGLVEQEDGFLALSTDVSVEGVHFRLDWITSEEVGWRATAAALSDLAAEAADPIGVLCAVTMPRYLSRITIAGDHGRGTGRRRSGRGTGAWRGSQLRTGLECCRHSSWDALGSRSPGAVLKPGMGFG